MVVMAFTKEDKDYNISEDFTLKPEQQEAIHYVLEKPNRIMGLQTGLGKTIACLISADIILQNTDNTVCFILCPKSAISSFKKELETKIDRVYSIYTADEKKDRPNSRYFIFNYSGHKEMIKRLKEFTSNGIKVFGLFDEVHKLASQDSLLSKDLRKVRHLFRCIIGATATPLLNDVEQMYRIISFVRPGYLGSERDFKSRYCILKDKIIYSQRGRIKIKEVVGHKNLNELKAKLDDIIIIKRISYNLNFIYKKAFLTKNEILEYNTAAKGIIDSGDEKQYSSRLHDLQRVADGTHSLQNFNDYSKIKILLQTISEIVRKGQGVIVYTEYEDTYEKLGKVIQKYQKDIGYRNLYFITGKTRQAKRVEVEKNLKFKDICIITKAGCQSINLQAVNNIIFYNIPFAVADLIQGVGRITRLDSKYNEQNCYFIEAEDTIDTYKILLIQHHTHLIKALFGNETSLPDVDKIDKDFMNKYRSYLKRKLLWRKK